MKRILSTVLMALVLAPLAYAQDAMQAKIDSLRANLGAAVGQERSTARNGRVQDFEKGSIYWSADTGVRLVTGDALMKYKDLGAEGGSLGYPVSDERPTQRGVSQTFEHGFITTNRAGDTQAEILEGVTLSESALTIIGNSAVLAGFGEDGILTVREVSGPDITLTCSCEKAPSPNSTRLGICNLAISKSRKSATCRNRDCSGSCGFETVDK